MLFVGFLEKIFNRYLVNTYYLKLYVISKREGCCSSVEAVSLSFICGAKNLKELQKMYPMFTRERIRQMLLKAERVGKFIHRGKR
jgi:hypothetical protein